MTDLAKASTKELVAQAREHYNKISTEAGESMGIVLEALNFYELYCDDLMMKGARWVPAIEEPYYANLVEKIGHFIGIHVYPYVDETKPHGMYRCLICQRLKSNN